MARTRWATIDGQKRQSVWKTENSFGRILMEKTLTRGFRLPMVVLKLFERCRGLHCMREAAPLPDDGSRSGLSGVKRS